MITQAIRELRLHPSRFAAVLSAIILSVGFLTLTQTFVSTETGAVAKRQVLWAAPADVTVGFTADVPVDDADQDNPDSFTTKVQARMAEAEKVIKDDPAVAALSRASSGYAQFTDVGGDDHLLSWTTMPSEKSLQWARAAEGRLPEAATEIAIPRDLARSAGLKIGATLDLTASGLGKMTVVGLTDETSLFTSPVIVSTKIITEYPDQAGATSRASWAIKATSPDEVPALIARLDAGLRPLSAVGSPTNLVVQTGQATLDKALSDLTGTRNVSAMMVGIFGVIALLVGAIIIATTFAILVAQRRRQTGLLRAVGASRRQVFHRFLGEAIVIGTIGSLAGIVLGVATSALLSTFLTHSLVYGLIIPWPTLGGILLLGVLVTVLAALVPMRRSMKVAPLEALRPVDSHVQRRRHHLVQAILCELLVALGFVAAYAAVTVGQPGENWDANRGRMGVMLALLAGVLITIGVLASASLYIPLVLRVLGAIFSPLGATWRLAALNSRRNPGRAGATAVAIMLAVGLIVTLQVGQASVKATANHELDARYPIELMVVDHSVDPSGMSTGKPFTKADVDLVMSVPGVAKAAIAEVVRGEDIQLLSADNASAIPLTPLVMTPEVAAALPVAPDVKDGELGIDPDRIRHIAKIGDKVKMGSTTLTLVAARYADGVITPGTLATSGLKTEPRRIIAQLDNDKDALKISKQVKRVLAPTHADLWIEGGAVMKAVLGQVLDTMLLILLGLLGVATIIALLGVGNTLGLSVLERTRESALLRALGLQGNQLRWMLLVEAVMLALAGTLVGVAFGMFFGWLGVKAVMNSAGWEHVVFAISWPMTLGVIGIAVVAAILGSILPGRRAAKAAPVEALADIG